MTKDNLLGMVNELKTLASRSICRCTVAKFIACSDERVQDKLLVKEANPDYQFGNISCIEHLGLPERTGVIFVFTCKPGVLCLVNPSFLVIVDLITSSVTSIVDPYDPSVMSLLSSNCRCNSSGKFDGGSLYGMAADAMAALISLVNHVLGSGVACYMLTSSNECRNTDRCDEGMRILREFTQNPNRDTVKRLSDWMNASSMQEQCMRAIIEKGNADFSDFITYIKDILSSS